ncbi:hypothetical protein BC938DRAFT_479581 [Jimgerdemannia flammicorona]|uniref:Uncharacterized protein n=1 Tax=Jimgerdemannia flammicorona TaxID=994334 RepID=A0A433QXP9_9FUNG|nr:hypothetical protein BC938DRAFT_479581 [Jimgerdemannia flammicorona]
MVLKYIFGQRREILDFAQILENIRHLGRNAAIQKKAIIVERGSITMGNTQADSTIPFLVQWICMATEKFVNRFDLSSSGKIEVDMSEGTFILRYLGRLIDDLFTDCRDIELEWGEKALVASSQNRNTSDFNEEDDHSGLRQRIGKKSDCIGFRISARREDREELLIVEVAGPPSIKNEKKHKRDRQALLKGMKLALDRLVSNMDVERVRRMCVYGILVYGFTMTIYKCQLFHYRIYTTTVVEKLLLPTAFDDIKRLDKIFKSLIRVKLEMLRIIEELKDAAWESNEENEEGIFE